MNHVDCVIKHDVYPHRMLLCSKNIRVISFFVLKISDISKKIIYISWLILHRYSCGLKIKSDIGRHVTIFYDLIVRPGVYYYSFSLSVCFSFALFVYKKL